MISGSVFLLRDWNCLILSIEKRSSVAVLLLKSNWTVTVLSMKRPVD